MIKHIIAAFFPNVCASCKTIIDKDEFLCDYCFSMLEYPNFENVCAKCGCERYVCQCKDRKFYFDYLTAPYYNVTVAQRAMYSFKFGRNILFARFFAEKMVLAIKQRFFDTEFDCVTFVPMTQNSKRARGFNQSEILAKHISEILSVPLESGLLYSRRKKRPQHKMPFEKRFANVKDIYKSSACIEGKTILLVDDIKTSGATLNECAKALKKAGAAQVYCVTGLIGKISERKQKWLLK